MHSCASSRLMRKHLAIWHQNSNHNTLKKLLNHEVGKLHNNFYQLNPNRFRRWDSIGKIWKFIAGTSDAEDLKLIN
jgi:hypothetical protein